uniref:SRA1/Sec31 domain-containing protein n=1 Tax=Anopheles dirus TaxID=7168 RepID=A0A182NVH1_9DIPT
MSGENYRSATHDPGWNDPPKVATPPGATGNVQPKTLLNKRVPFPLQRPGINSSPATPSTTSSSQAPPLPQIPKSVPTGPAVAPGANSAANQDAELPNQDEMLRQIQAVFDEFVQYLDDPEKQADVEKRVNLIYQQFAENKLPDRLQKHLYELSSALKDKDDVRANVAHRSIACEYGSMSGMFAPVLRQFIFALQNEKTGTNNENEETDSKEN